jgi:histone H3/H4
MIRPQQIDSLPHLDASQKQTYKQGLMNLWNAFDNNPEGSQAKNDAKAKIQNASRKIMQQLQGGQRNPSNAAPQQAQQVQRPPQAQQGGAQGAQTQGVQQGAMQGQQNQQQMQQPQQQQQRPQQQQMQQPQQAQQQGGQDQVAQLQAKVKQMVQNLVVFPEPTTANSQQFEQYKLTFQQGLGTSILKRERARQEQIRLEGLEAQMKNSGQTLADEMVARLNSARAACAEAQRAVTALEQKNEQNKNLYNQKQARNKEMQQAGQQGQQVNGQQQMANQQVNGAQAQGMQRTNSQQTQGNVGQGDVKMEQQQQQSPAPPQFAQQQQQQQQQVQTPQVGTPVQQQQQMPPQQQQQQARPQQQGTPQSATQPQQQFPQNNMQQQQQQRPPMNQQQSQQHQQYGVPQQQQQQQQIPQQQQQPQQQYQQTPQSAMQQNNTPNQQQAPQQPHALTQRDAMARSAQSYTQQQQQQQGPNVNQPQQPMQQQHGNMPNGMPFNQPQSATQHTPTQAGFPPTQQMNSQNTKFPIPKDLRMDPRTQAPVAGPPSRPTMMGQGGMMNVPGVQKPAPFTLEGEGDHVLSKRKLDELVRQITGSVSPQDGLSPEVEEAVLSLTDNFVDNVIQKACALAKLRAGQTLEVKDIQMVLERNYGIRIPGYSLDELRTVRKFQPAPGWVGKVQAVQAGKVMGGNKDA